MKEQLQNYLNDIELSTTEKDIHFAKSSYISIHSPISILLPKAVKKNNENVLELRQSRMERWVKEPMKFEEAKIKQYKQQAKEAWIDRQLKIVEQIKQQPTNPALISNTDMGSGVAEVSVMKPSQLKK